MSDALKQAQRDLLSLQCKATAALQLQMSSALTGKGQDELRKHFAKSAELFVKCARHIADGCPK